MVATLVIFFFGHTLWLEFFC